MCNCENELIRELNLLLFMLHVFYNTRMKSSRCCACSTKRSFRRELDVLLFMLHVLQYSYEKFPVLCVQYQTFIPKRWPSSVVPFSINRGFSEFWRPLGKGPCGMVVRSIVGTVVRWLGALWYGG